MESEPLVSNKNPEFNVGDLKMNYNVEDGSSILNRNTEVEQNLTCNETDKQDGEKGEDFSNLEKFHEDTLQQVGVGKMQFVLFIISGLVMAADLSELMALIMSSKSAQFEFCVDETQKSWLVGATLLGMGVGSIFWGALGDRVGRRRALIYCLGHGSIFSAASVIMPNEGTFLTARLFSGFGLGGCMPLVVPYFAEFIPSKHRRLATTILFLFWPLGAGYVILISWFILPSTGFHLSEELKEHFSAWRRLLLAAWAPCLLSIVGLIFMPDGPLNLMQTGKDAASLDVYKRIHKCNGSDSAFAVAEIEIPSIFLGSIISPSNVIGDLKKACDSFWNSFLTLWTENRRRFTVTVSLLWLFSALGQSVLSSWIVSHQATLRDWTFGKDTKMSEHGFFNHTVFTEDLVNIRYQECFFQHVTFQNIMMNHVKFENCTFNHVNFTNAKASFVIFKYSELVNCVFVDTNLGRSNFHQCYLDDIEYEGLDPACHLIPDFSMDITNDVIDAGLPVVGMFFGGLLSLILCRAPCRSKIVFLLLVLSSFISIGLGIWTYDPTWALVAHVILNFFIGCVWSILVTTLDQVPFWAWSAALGLGVSGAKVGSFFGVGLFGTTMGGIVVPTFSAIVLILSGCIAVKNDF